MLAPTKHSGLISQAAQHAGALIANTWGDQREYVHGNKVAVVKFNNF